MPDLAGVTRVLVVEDNPELRQLVGDVLADAGYAVRLVGDGAAALALLEQWRPDLVVLDLMMPVLDGETFLRIRRDSPALRSLPILVVTAHPQHHRVLDGLAPTVVLPKPYDLDEFLALVASLASGEQGHEQAG